MPPRTAASTRSGTAPHQEIAAGRSPGHLFEPVERVPEPPGGEVEHPETPRRDLGIDPVPGPGSREHLLGKSPAACLVTRHGVQPHLDRPVGQALGRVPEFVAHGDAFRHTRAGVRELAAQQPRHGEHVQGVREPPQRPGSPYHGQHVLGPGDDAVVVGDHEPTEPGGDALHQVVPAAAGGGVQLAHRAHGQLRPSGEKLRPPEEGGDNGRPVLRRGEPAHQIRRTLQDVVRRPVPGGVRGLVERERGALRIGVAHQRGGLERQLRVGPRRGAFVLHGAAGVDGIGPHADVGGERERFGRQPGGAVGLARVERGLARPGDTPGLQLPVGTESTGALVGSAHGHRSASVPGPLRHAFEFGGHRLVGFGGGGSEVPGPAVGIGVRVQRLGVRAMYLDPPVQRRVLVGGGPDQGMAERDPAVDPDQPVTFGGRQVACGATEGFDHVQDRRKGRSRVGRRHQKRALGRVGKVHDLVAKRLLHAAGHRQRADLLGRVGLVDIAGREPRRPELDDRQGIAAGLRENPRPHPFGEFRCVVVEQPGGIGRGEAGQLHDLDARDHERHRRLAYREQHRDRVGHEAAGREQQRLHGALVEPLQVVDHAQQRRVLGQIGEQRQGARGDQEPVGFVSLGETESTPQCPRLGSGQGVQPIKVRKQELVQTAVGQFGVGLDPCPADHLYPLGFGDRHSVVEKHRLPDTRCAPQPQYAAARVARLRQQALNPRQLDVPPHQRHAVTLDGRGRRIRPTSRLPGPSEESRAGNGRPPWPSRGRCGRPGGG